MFTIPGSDIKKVHITSSYVKGMGEIVYVRKSRKTQNLKSAKHFNDVGEDSAGKLRLTQ